MALKGLANPMQNAVTLINTAKFTVALTGAGCSTPSGIPDFRSRDSGLWTRFPPMEVASLSAFRRNPQRFFNWFRPLATKIVTAKPNPAHYALAQLEQHNHLNTIITQNIDGLHQRSGSVDVLQVHGSLDSMTCIGCYQHAKSEDFTRAFISHGEIPHCEDCGEVLKPDIVLVEEQLPAEVWLKARQVTFACDLMIIAGTSLVVSPVAKLPEQARNNGAQIIIVNKTSTYMDEFADVVIHEDVGEILPEITSNLINV